MKKKLLMIITIIKVALLASALFLVSCNERSDTATPSGGDTAIGEVIGTAEGKIFFKGSGKPEIGNVYAGVSNMTCTLEVEEAGKSPTTYNGICGKSDVEVAISFRDKEDDPSISASLVVPNIYYLTEEIEYSKEETIKGENPHATTTVIRKNNVWEGKITDGGTDLLKLTIKTKDKVVPAPTGSKPCQLVKKQVYSDYLNDYTLNGNCVLAYDTAGTTVTNINFTSSLANPPVTASLPIEEIEITEDNLSILDDYFYRIGGYLHANIDYVASQSGSINVFKKPANDNEFTALFYLPNTVLEFDIVLTE